MSTRSIVAALALTVAACDGKSDQPIADAVATIKRGDALYADAKYHEAFDIYNVAAKALDRKDSMLFIEASRRAGRAFCRMEFADARRDLAAGDSLTAFLAIDITLADPACKEFADEIAWAQEQKRLRPR